MRRELAKTPVDAALLAVDAADAARAKPYVGTIPSYTSSEVNERQPPDALRDLDDVRFVDIPWLVDADAAAFADLKRPDYPNPDARAALRARDGRLPGRAGISRTARRRSSSSTAPPAIFRSTKRASSSARAG